MRAAPQNRMVTLMWSSPRNGVADLAAQGGREDIVERDRIGRMRHAVGRTDRANAGVDECGRHLRWKQRMRDDGVDRGGAGGRERLGAGDQRAARRDDIVDQQHRPAGERCWVGKCDLDRAIAAASLLRNRVCQPEPAGEIAHPGPGLRVRTDHDGCGIDAGPREARSAIAGMADRLSASMPGKTALMSAVRCRWASTVMTRSTVSASSRPIAFWLIASPSWKAASCRM